MFEQQIIENGTFDLKSCCLAGEAAIAKNQLKGFAGIAQMKLGPELFWKTSRFESGQNAHCLEEATVVGQQ